MSKKLLVMTEDWWNQLLVGHDHDTSVAGTHSYNSCPNNSTNHCGEYLSCRDCWAAHIKEGGKHD